MWGKLGLTVYDVGQIGVDSDVGQIGFDCL